METITLISTNGTFFWQHVWRKVKANDWLIPALGFLFIALVSIHDTYLVVIEEHILKLEQNPICAYLIRLEPVGLTYFIIGKLLGALVVISILSLLHRTKHSHANFITGSVVVFQAFLVIYLHLSDPLIGGLPNFMLLFNG